MKVETNLKAGDGLGISGDPNEPVWGHPEASEIITKPAAG